MRYGKKDDGKKKVAIKCKCGHLVEPEEDYGWFYYCKKCEQEFDDTDINHKCEMINKFDQVLEVKKTLKTYTGLKILPMGEWDVNFCPICGISLS